VPATRRAQTPEEVPYACRLVSETDNARERYDLASLATQVPGLSVYDFGARFAGATHHHSRLTQRANPGDSNIRAGPIGTYIGNSPINGDFTWPISAG